MSMWASPMAGHRDLRIDFMRGVVMFLLIVLHLEFLSLYNLVAWERVGFVSGGEGFVILSGCVVGMVFGSRVRKEGFRAAASRLFDRALQLYRVNIVIILAIAFLAAFTLADTREVTTFTDRGAGITYPLYWAPGAPIRFKVAQTLLLQAGPHQMQVLGLYVILLLASPLALWLLDARRTGVLLLVSAVLYARNWATPVNLTGAQFENGFPLLTWQFIYILGLAAGFHRERLVTFFRTKAGTMTFAAACLVALACLAFAQATPNPFLPAWARVEWMDPERFNVIHRAWFDKNTLGLGRIVNYVALLLVGYGALTRFWRGFGRAFGWFFVPIGQASLYVFVVHVFLVLLASQWIPFGFANPNLVVNTIAHTAALAIVWLLVRYQVLFGWIPR